MLARIKEKRETVVVPVIDIIRDKDMAYLSGKSYQTE